MLDVNSNADHAEREAKMEKVLKHAKESKVKKDSKAKKESKVPKDGKLAKEMTIVDSPAKAKKRSAAKLAGKSAIDTDMLGFEPDRILGATDCWNGQLAFRFKVKDSHKFEFVPAKIAHVACPQLVISFYEEHLVFDEV